MNIFLTTLPDPFCTYVVCTWWELAWSSTSQDLVPRTRHRHHNLSMNIFLTTLPNAFCKNFYTSLEVAWSSTSQDPVPRTRHNHYKFPTNIFLTTLPRSCSNNFRRSTRHRHHNLSMSISLTTLLDAFCIKLCRRAELVWSSKSKDLEPRKSTGCRERYRSATRRMARSAGGGQPRDT